MTIKLSEKMKKIAEAVIDEHLVEFQELDIEKYKVAYLISDQAKTANGMIVHGECALVPSKYKWTCPYDFTITFFKPNIEHMDDEQLYILMYHELKHAGIKKEKPYIIPHDLNEFKDIVNKYGTDWGRNKNE